MYFTFWTMIEADIEGFANFFNQELEGDKVGLV